MKKLIPIILCFAVILCCVFAFASCNKGCDHEYGKWISGTSANCTEDGVVGHYACNKCGKNFDNKFNEIANITVSATQHRFDNIYDSSCNACGADREYAKDVLSVSVNASHATINYASGKVEKIALNKGSAECVHPGMTTYELEAHTETSDGKYLDMCAECGLIQVVDDTRHDTDGRTVTVEPTCTLAGSASTFCSVCGKAGDDVIIDALGHDFGDPKLVQDDNKNICEDGAIEIITCKVCSFRNIVTLDANASEGYDGCHTVSEWEITSAPSYLSEGTMAGICDECECYVEYVLPAVNDEDNFYSVTVSVPRSDCASDDGVAECVFSVSDTNQTLTFTTALLPVMHTLNGVDIDPDEKYDVTLAGIIEDPASPVSCKDTDAVAHFVCDTCEETVEINVFRQHTVASWSVLCEPTCEYNGIRTGNCAVDGCGALVAEQIAPLGHEYAYGPNFTFETNDGEYVSFTVPGVCTRVQGGVTCGHETEYVCLAEDANYVYIAPTCTNNGAHSYEITLPNNEIKIINFSIGSLHHHISGTVLPAAGTVFAIDDYPELIAEAPANFTCGTTFEVHFSCSVCSEIVTVEVFKRHTYDEATWEIITPATCLTDGERTNRCSNPNCLSEFGGQSGEVVYEVIPALGHSYEYTDIVLVDAAANQYELYGECANLDCTETCVRSVTDPVISVTSAPNCVNEGTREYVCDIDGETAVYVEAIPTTKHHLNGVEMNNESGVPYVFDDHAGMCEFVNKTVTCHSIEEAYFVCDDCGNIVNVYAQKKHTVLSYAWTVTLPATCASAGLKTGTCSVSGCGATVTEEIAPISHSYTYSFDADARILNVSCANSGCTEEYILTDVEEIITLPATCTASGTKTYTGIDANGDSVTVCETVAMIDHIISDVVTNNLGQYPLTEGKVYLFADEALDCHSTAKGYYICDACGEPISVIVYQPHIFLSPEISTAPTCTEPGEMRSTCILCDSYATESIAPLGHSYEFTVSTLPTATATGLVVGCCTADGCTAACTPVVLPVLTDASYVVAQATAPACESNGTDVYSYTFIVSGNSYTVSIEVEVPALGHAQGDNDTFVFTHDELITYVDPDGNEVSDTVSILYTVYECDNDGCNVHILVNKEFVHVGAVETLYVYDEATDTWVASAPAV